jgi:hypothetical protein
MKVRTIYFMCLFLFACCTRSTTAGDASQDDGSRPEAEHDESGGGDRAEGISEAPGGEETDGGVPDHVNASQCGQPDRVLPRAIDGDALCSGREDCYQTSGSPLHGGCPNTCSCLCMYGVCYQHSCTMVGGCTEPPEYN